MKLSWKKTKKVDLLCALIDHTPITESEFTRKQPKKYISTLASLCKKAITKKTFPKSVLCAAYASYTFPKDFKEWQAKSPIDAGIQIEGFERCVPFWYSFPELNETTGELLAKSIDCSHNLTHLRVRTCTTGIAGVSSDGFKACARSNETPLSLPLVEDLVDKQSVPNARTQFSMEVEKWLSANDYLHAANLARHVRNWYEASDKAGMLAFERVQKLLEMRDFLLTGIDFGQFPPPGRYIKQIPIVTFEGMCIDIDTKLQMYGMAGTYNIRSVESLAAETTVGILQSLSPISQVPIKARDVPSLMSNVAEVMTCKMSTDRGFYMRTSRNSGVYPVHESDVQADQDDATVASKSTSNLLTKFSTNIVLRDHPFDKPERGRVSRKMRFGTISKPMEPSRGAMPVRQWHKTDESKILATKRLGIGIQELL
ncbi:uncharacterized protein LOC117315212 [Pecten maximus]|uniref:uncharacterized protein LOC117315212 n=1 Tax=Pecten maximus TaxID=6579 RepID=UPI001458A3B2|nr:uncharacterized protein LOC117315212 [Pecten maximus]